MINAKLLLFGEHTILKGSQALAMPLSLCSGRWKKGENIQDDLLKWGDYLQRKKKEYLLLEALDVQSFIAAVKKGLFFDSDIPQGYGLGSSGALCAALYDRFFSKKNKNIQSLKEIFALLESYFHGSSSGIDPLVCYLDKPLLFSKSSIQVVDLPESTEKKGGIFLLDTHIKRQTAPYVDHFLEKTKDHYFNAQCTSILMPANDEAIHTFLKGKYVLLQEIWHEISFFQFKYFEKMILPKFRDIWLQGLEQNHYKLKLCGAGGGGFILGITQDIKLLKNQSFENDIKIIIRF